MLNINEDELKAAIVDKVADEILHSEAEMQAMVSKIVEARINAVFVAKANDQIEAAINSAIEHSFDREYQRVTSWGEPEGPKTTIRAQLENTVSAYWSTQVDPRTGKPSTGYGDKVTRAEYLMTQVCADDFSAGLRQSALNVTGALKDGLRNQMAVQMDALLNSLFKVTSLQDQGKVEKPY